MGIRDLGLQKEASSSRPWWSRRASLVLHDQGWQVALRIRGQVPFVPSLRSQAHRSGRTRSNLHLLVHPGFSNPVSGNIGIAAGLLVDLSGRPTDCAEILVTRLRTRKRAKQGRERREIVAVVNRRGTPATAFRRPGGSV